MKEEIIKKNVLPILYVTDGEMDMEQIKSDFHKYIVLTEEDRQQSKSRNEMVYKQQIGNIGSHQKAIRKDYKYGYELDKRTRPSKFIIQKGFDERVDFTNDELDVLKEERNNTYLIKKRMGVESLPKIKEDILTEIEEYEKQRVESFSDGQQSRIYNIAADYPQLADQYMFHLISINAEGYPISIFIEKAEQEDDLETHCWSKEAMSFVQSRSTRGHYSQNKNFIYFVQGEGTDIQIHRVNTAEYFKEEN